MMSLPPENDRDAAVKVCSRTCCLSDHHDTTLPFQLAFLLRVAGDRGFPTSFQISFTSLGPLGCEMNPKLCGRNFILVCTCVPFHFHCFMNSNEKLLLFIKRMVYHDLGDS